MPTNMKLNDTQLRNLKPADKVKRLSDGGGLYIEVMPTGSTYWRMAYRFQGKQKRLAFGVYPIVSLKIARERRDEAKRLLDQGIDPSAAKKQQKLETTIHHRNTFEAIAREWHEQKKHTWKSEHAATILKRLETNVFSKIGQRPIKDISAPELLAAIRVLQDEGKRDLAHRQLQHCGQIFRYAIATGRAEQNIATHLKGALQPVRSKNYAHLSEKQLPAFLRELERYEEEYKGSRLVKLAFKLLILTFVRSGEIRGALWSEVDWQKKQWRIPAERMKVKEPHIVPLSKQSVAILKELHDITGDSYTGAIFPSQQSPRKMMSENTFLRAIEVLGYKGVTTAHGFRSTASTILNENGFRSDVIERQLAHGERDQVRAAYNHAEYLSERAEMMQWWADYLGGLSRR
jgi:integrase